MIDVNDVCSCGHTREHHTLSCKSLRPVGIGSTPPGFRQHMERCPCLGFVLWRTADEVVA